MKKSRKNTKKVIVIGTGIGGLATAALLAKKGYTVTMLEKNDHIGGRASIWKSKGFTFDMGPSWYLMPDVFERYFSLFKKKPSDFYKLTRLDPQYRVYFGKNDYVDIVKDLKSNLKLFEKLEPGVSKKIEDYLQRAEKDYIAAKKYILYNNFKSIKDYLRKDLMREGKRMRIFESLDHYTKRFTQNHRIQQILQYSIVFLGGSPKNTPAFYSIMSHIDFNLGVFYPQKGIHSIINALATLCKSYRVTIETGKEVKKICVENGKVTGVRTAEKEYDADIVISNADYAFTETHLLEKKYQSYDENYWKKKTIAPSAFLIYLGVRGKIKNLKHHTLSFANNWQDHFEEIFSTPQWPKKPSFYVCCPSKTDQSVAPKNGENLFILVPVATGIHDSDSQRTRYAKKMIAMLEKLTGESISDRIITQRIFSQRDFTSEYNAYNGTALGLAHTLTQTAHMRPSILSKKVKNLLYVGQYTQPGIGMPMCLIAAELVAKEVDNSA